MTEFKARECGSRVYSLKSLGSAVVMGIVVPQVLKNKVNEKGLEDSNRRKKKKEPLLPIPPCCNY